MGLLDFLFGTASVMSAMNKRGHDQPRGLSDAQFDDGYPDDYVGDGLDGTDDYVGDGLDGTDGYDDPE